MENPFGVSGCLCSNTYKFLTILAILINIWKLCQQSNYCRLKIGIDSTKSGQTPRLKKRSNELSSTSCSLNCCACTCNYKWAQISKGSTIDCTDWVHHMWQFHTHCQALGDFIYILQGESMMFVPTNFLCLLSCNMINQLSSVLHGYFFNSH